MSQTKKIILLALAVFLFVVWESFGDMFISYPINNYPPKSDVVLAWGDGFTLGVGATSPSAGYIEVLRNRLSANITNKAVKDEVSSSTLAHAVQDLAEVKPGIVLLFIGEADAHTGIPATQTLENTRKLIALAQENHAVVYLVGFQVSAQDAYALGFESLGKEMGAVYTGDILGGISGNSAYMTNDTYPNDKGYLKIADKLAPMTESLILSASASSSPASI